MSMSFLNSFVLPELVTHCTCHSIINTCDACTFTTVFLYYQVQPGDVLGFISLNGKLADVDVGKLCSSYSSSMTKTEFPESGSATDVNYEFFLNAHLSTYSHLLVSVSIIILHTVTCW